MKPLNFLIPAGTLVAGFSLAWIIAPLARPAASGQGEGHEESSRLSKRSVRSHDSKESARTSDLLDGLLVSAEPYRFRKLEIGTGEIAEADYPALLAELIKRVEETRLTNENETMMNFLISAWHDANPDAALNWVLEMENRNAGDRMLSTIIAKVAHEDPEAAIALAERHGAAAGNHIKMPHSLIKHLSGVDAETFVRVFGCFIGGAGGSRISMDYAEGFDFRRALDKLTEIRSGLEEGVHFSDFPGNMLSEWAKRDWNAAWEWALSTEESPFKELTAIVNQGAIHATTEERAGYAAQIAQLPNRTSEENYREAYYILIHHSSPELVAGFLSQVTGDRQENLDGILAQSISGDGILRNMMLAQMTPAERMNAFQSEAVQNSLSQIRRSRDPLVYQLRQLGHSDEEIFRMLPPVPDP